MTTESEKKGPWGGLSAEALEQARREREKDLEAKVMPELAKALGIDQEGLKPVQEGELPEDVRRGFSEQIPEGVETHVFSVDLNSIKGNSNLGVRLRNALLEMKAQEMVDGMCDTISGNMRLYEEASKRFTQVYNEVDPPTAIAFAIFADMLSQLIIAKDSPKLRAEPADVAVRTLAFVQMLRRSIDFDMKGGECQCPECTAMREAENEKGPVAG